MKDTDYKVYTIDRLIKGYVFTYDDFIADVNKKEAAMKALNRMAERLILMLPILAETSFLYVPICIFKL